MLSLGRTQSKNFLTIFRKPNEVYKVLINHKYTAIISIQRKYTTKILLCTRVSVLYMLPIH